MKKLIRKYLINKFENRKLKRFYFLRWLVDIITNKSDLYFLLDCIALWMVKQKSIHLRFTDIFLVGNNLYVYTPNPGDWIGKGGKTIDDFETFINDTLGEKYRVNIIEDRDSLYKKLNDMIYFWQDYVAI